MTTFANKLYQENGEKTTMYEEIIRELIKVKNLKLDSDTKSDLIRYAKRPNPDRKQLSVVRKWAKKLDIPTKAIISLSKYNEVEEIWKN